MSDDHHEPPIAVHATSRQKGLLHELHALGQARDGMIVAVAVVYLWGFASWAIYSWRLHIGFARIIDAQYLAGGVLPSLSLLVLYFSWRVSIYVRDLGFGTTARRLPVDIWVLGGIAILFLGYVPYFKMIPLPLDMMLLSAHELSPADRAKAIWFFIWLLFFMSVLIYLGIAGFPDFGTKIRGSNNLGFQILQLVYRLIALSIAVYTIAFYIGVLYPNLPQEIGGAQARCVNLILDPKKTPAPLLAQLNITHQADTPGVGAADTGVTLPGLHLLYADEKELVLTAHTTAKHPISLELSRDLVVGMIDCGD